jgi:hypothetical protein
MNAGSPRHLLADDNRSISAMAAAGAFGLKPLII